MYSRSRKLDAGQRQIYRYPAGTSKMVLTRDLAWVR